MTPQPTPQELEEIIKANGGQAPQSPQAAADGLVNTGNDILASFEDNLINGAPGDPSKTPFGQYGRRCWQ